MGSQSKRRSFATWRLREIEFDHRSNFDCSLNLPNEEAVDEPVNEIPCSPDWAGASGFPSIWVRIHEVSLKGRGRRVIAQRASSRLRRIRMALKVILPLDVRRSKVVRVRQSLGCTGVNADGR